MKKCDGPVPAAKEQFAFIRDIVLTAGKRDKQDYGHCVSFI